MNNRLNKTNNLKPQTNENNFKNDVDSNGAIFMLK